MEARSTLSYEAVCEKVRDFILANFLFGDVEKMPADNDSLLQRGVIDSTGILELINFVEQEFAVSVDDTETVPENLDGIGNIARFVRMKMADHEGRL